MLRTVDLDAVSSLYVFASTNEHSCHVTSFARPTPPGLARITRITKNAVEKKDRAGNESRLDRGVCKSRTAGSPGSLKLR